MLSPFEHEEDRPQKFMRQGDDGAFVATANDQGLELQLEDRLGSTGGMSELTEEPADIEVAFTDTSGFTFTCRLVVAGTDAAPERYASGKSLRWWWSSCPGWR